MIVLSIYFFIRDSHRRVDDEVIAEMRRKSQKSMEIIAQQLAEKQRQDTLNGEPLSESFWNKLYHKNLTADEYHHPIETSDAFQGVDTLSDKKYVNYKEYINSPKWKEKRSSRAVFDNYKCQYCGSDVSTYDGDAHTPNVHHLHYDTLGRENIETDLVTLCQQCHHQLHIDYSLKDMEKLIRASVFERNNRDRIIDGSE